MPRWTRPQRGTPASPASCSIPTAPPRCWPVKWWRYSVDALFAGENAFRQLDVHAEIRLIHQLRDSHVSCNAHQLIGLMARELLLRHQEIHHLLNRSLGGNDKIRIGSHADVVGGGFGAWPFELHVLAHRQLQAAAQ